MGASMKPQIVRFRISNSINQLVKRMKNLHIPNYRRGFIKNSCKKIQVKPQSWFNLPFS